MSGGARERGREVFGVSQKLPVVGDLRKPANRELGGPLSHGLEYFPLPTAGKGVGRSRKAAVDADVRYLGLVSITDI